ncbi:MAG: NAD(P)/FAD-dependent oxidoreductase [Chitinophagaceae bacterium]|nr:MAG: NAD(P)/FAD-dependent oxidoreductase [Chitinophagaceae bacterium]
MQTNEYDIIIIGSGSGGLTIGLFMSQAGFRVLMISKSDRDIGGDCLNDGCIPSKALIHVAKIIHNAGLSSEFGLQINGSPDYSKVKAYIRSKQELIREHENAGWLQQQGIEVALGGASFAGKNAVEVNGKTYTGKKIVIATGSVPSGLIVPGSEKVRFLNNENIFELESLPQKLLVIGGGPIGIELAQALSRLGCRVTLIHKGKMILERDELSLAEILLARLREEGIIVELNSTVESFPASDEATINTNNGARKTIRFDAVLLAVGRDLSFTSLRLEKGGIQTKDEKIIVDKHLRTTNRNVFVCGDVAGDLKFSHAAEFHARILINNFFSPFKKTLHNRHMSWVTFSDPQLATFGYSEKQLKAKNIRYVKAIQDLNMDDRAVVGGFGYGRVILYITPKNIFGNQKILGGTMIAPEAGELIQELILANTTGMSINAIFNKIYPYPVAARANQALVVKLKEQELNSTIKKLLKNAFKIFG